MRNKLEQLLNSLIEKGWKPRGENAMPNSYWVEGNSICWNRGGKAGIRELVSKESCLRQFVCDREHRFIDKKNYGGVNLDKRLKNPYVDYDGVNTEYEWITSLDYQYWLIESALKDESELEEFLLNSIIIDD